MNINQNGDTAWADAWADAKLNLGGGLEKAHFKVNPSGQVRVSAGLPTCAKQSAI